MLQESFFTAMRSAEEVLGTEFNQHVLTRTVYLRAREFHFAMGKWSLWFDSSSPLEEQIARYRIFLKEVGLPAVKDYIDLRIAGRVVYK